MSAINLTTVLNILKHKLQTFPAKRSILFGIRKRVLLSNVPKSEFHGRVQGKNYPNYNPTIFLGDSVESDWLFDLGADSASRPIGVTGARGN